MSGNYAIAFEPPIDAHPSNGPTPAFEVGDVVRILPYNGVKVARADGEDVGEIRYLTDKVRTDPAKREAAKSAYEVVEVDGYRWRGTSSPLEDQGFDHWFPRDIVVSIDEDERAAFEAKRAAKQAEQRNIARRAAQSQAEVMELCRAHARSTCAEVWPGGTVDPGELTWFWWSREGGHYGRCWKFAQDSSAEHHGATVVDPGQPAIGLNWSRYVQEGPESILKTVRHELIHAWQALHPDNTGMNHHRSFKQWCPDMDLPKHRLSHCDDS
jgi:hypothetical protein